jgi:RNA polymerase sigma-70 factor (ECF subfamily)
MDENSEKIEQIIVDYTKIVYNFVFRLTLDKVAAEDITQETFIRVWQKFDKYDPTRPLKSWILAVAHNCARDYFRKRKIILFSELSTDEFDFEENLIDEEKTVDEIFDETIDAQKMRETLDKLSANEKEIILLHLEQDLTFAEISEILKKSLNTIKSVYRRSLLKIKKLFGK